MARGYIWDQRRHAVATYLPPGHRVGRDSREWADIVGKAGRGSARTDRDRALERGNEPPLLALRADSTSSTSGRRFDTSLISSIPHHGAHGRPVAHNKNKAVRHKHRHCAVAGPSRLPGSRESERPADAGAQCDCCLGPVGGATVALNCFIEAGRRLGATRRSDGSHRQGGGREPYRE